MNLIKRKRASLNIRINPKIKKEFLAAIRENDLNICHVAEALFIAWVEGTKNRPPDIGLPAGSTLIVKQTFENVVARDRRTKRLFRPEANCYLNGCWTYRAPEKEEILSQLHHVPECACNVCNPFVGRH